VYYLDLFSGIGGFALGAYWAGWRFDEHYFSEVDDYCVKLYSQRFKDAHSLGDIRTISTMGMPQGDWIITGGFPCQDISVAGKGEGISGARSGLWFEMWRIIRILRPRFVIIENVGAITFRGLDSVLSSLAEIGYDAEWQDIRASDVGAPHKRERIWIVAYPASRRCERGRSHKVGTTGQMANGATGGNQDVADTTGAGLERQESTGRNRGESGLFTECCGWEFEPDVGRLASRISHRVDRLKALGNSIVPEIAELLFRRIGEIICR